MTNLSQLVYVGMHLRYGEVTWQVEEVQETYVVIAYVNGMEINHGYRTKYERAFLDNFEWEECELDPL